MNIKARVRLIHRRQCDTLQSETKVFELPDFLNPDFYKASGDVSIVVAEAGIATFCLSGWTFLTALRVAITRRSVTFFWLSIFSLSYALWNILYLFAAAQRDMTVLEATLTSEIAERGQLFFALILPYVAYRFLYAFLGRKNISTRIGPVTIVAILFLILLLNIFNQSDQRILFLVGGFTFSGFLYLSWKLFFIYRKTDDLKLKTRSFFIFLGLLICTIFSFVGQLRADRFFAQLPLPYIGNILTSVFIYFIYQMSLNPRLREVRELMLRGIRVLLLTVVLTIIFVSLLAWVGENNVELFLFNTFLASFLILTILEPLRKELDRFFVKQFIVDRYEFEELLRRLPRRLRKARTTAELATELTNGVRESGRIYQAALYLWDASTLMYRLVEPSNLTFITNIPQDDPLMKALAKSKSYLLLEQDQDLPAELQKALDERHTHILLPLMKQDELLGAWALRSSLRSTNPYTSFSNDEIGLLCELSHEVVSALEQIHHFDAQERKERLATLGEMSAALAHEIRNPLGAIQGSIQLLHTSPTLQDRDDKECVDILVKECSRLQRTVDQYLSFARKSEEPVSIIVSDLAKAIIHELQAKAEKTKTQLHLTSSPAIPTLKSDPLKLEQVLFNFIQNACEAFSKNVWVTIDLLHEAGQNWITIEIKDDGPGISPKNLENIFNPLFTTKKAGSGLGLPICKKIIDSLDGRLSVTSEMGVGTTFSVHLPVKGDS